MARLAALVLLLAASIAAQTPARALPLNRFPDTRPVAGLYPMPTAIGDDYFDGSDPHSRIDRHMDLARRLGARYLRCAFSWNGIEKEPGRYDWRFWDALVAAAEKRRIGLIPYVAYTPEWAARDRRDFYKQPPRDPRLYAEFLYAAAARYRGRIRSWEIWNEPDNQDYWTGSAAEFAGLVSRAARRIRDADPDAVLVLGGMANGPSDFFRALMVEHRIDRYVDVVAVHAYPESWLNQRAETIFEEWLPAIRRLVDANGSGAAVWLNEMGYADYRLRPDAASIYGTNVFYRYEHTPDYQAAMLFKLHVLTLANPGVSLSGWYRIDDFPHADTRIGTDLVNHHLGVVDVRGRPKPAFRAMRFFNRLFHDPVASADFPVDRPAASQSVVKVFRVGAARAVVVAWLRSSHPEEVPDKSGMLEDPRAETVSIHPPCRPRRLRGYDAQGRRVPAPSLENVRLTGDRVFIAEIECAAGR
jgi:hypothetical protein